MGPAKPLSALLASTTITDHAEILRACTGTSKPDLQTQHIHLIALLKLDRYDDALRLLEEAGSGLKEKSKLEWAYALYKTGQLEEARKLAREVGDGEDGHGEGGGRGARHVDAQASYRSEDFAHAAEIYRVLQRTGDAATIRAEESDVRVNSGATDAQLEWKRQGGLVQRKGHAREDLEAYETAYNAACGSIARGELGKGEFLLNAAKGLCASMDELSDAEKTAEILPIQVQQLYVLGRLGKTAEAEKLASEIAVQDIPDAATRQIAHNNLLASTSTPANPYLSHRLVHDSPTLPKTETLFAHQASLIEHNTIALDLSSSKSSAVVKSTARSLSKNPSPTLDPHVNDLSVLNAAAHAQSQLAKLGLKSILPLVSQRPTDVGLAMTIIQLYMLTSNPSAATTVLESLLKNISTSRSSSNEDILYAPGLVALQVSLYSLQNRRSAVRAVLAKAASYWRHKSKTAHHNQNQKEQQHHQATSLFRAAGLELLSSTNPTDHTEAREIFTALHTANPDDKFATAGFIAAHALPSSSDPKNSTISPALAKEAESTLSPTARLIADIDTPALEAAGIPTLPSSTLPKTNTATAKKRKADVAEKPKKKRVRLSKRPKDFVDEKKMDEERWLPLRERSSYRVKGKKGRRKQLEQTQGGPVAAEGGKGVEGSGAGGIRSGGGVVGAVPGAGGGGGGGGGGGAGKGKGKKKGKK